MSATALPPFRDDAVSFLGVPIHPLTMEETLDRAVRAMRERQPLQHVALNVAKFVKLRDDPHLRGDVFEAGIVGIDGMGILLGARLFGIRAPERVAGVDLMEKLLALCAVENFRPYLLGATPEVLGRAVRVLGRRHPDLELAGYRDGYFSAAEEPAVVAAIRASGADCLFVGMPTPRKEHFMAAHRSSLGVPFVMGVGGGLDILAGHTKRAPLPWQRAGMEWLFRTLQEPRRMWRRYLSTNLAYAGILLRAAVRERPSTWPTAVTDGMQRDSIEAEDFALTSKSTLNICLTGSGGGHVRQLLDLQPAWEHHRYFFLTEDTPLARHLAMRWPTHFVAHYALGQARLGSPLKMLRAALKNCVASAKVILHERPDAIIATGAASAFFALLWGRLIGAKIVIVESFARFDSPSKFLRIAAPFADHLVVQSGGLLAYLPKAELFNPLKILDVPRPPKRPLVFVTVGATLPFDRLIRSVAELRSRGDIPEEIVAQTGIGGVLPDGMNAVETLPFDRVEEISREADIVICHGGTGSLITALRQGCRVIVMPRLAHKGEHYDNHQKDVTRAFEALGLIAVANNTEELAAALKTVRNRNPLIATTDPKKLNDYLIRLLTQWTDEKSSLNRRRGSARSGWFGFRRHATVKH